MTGYLFGQKWYRYQKGLKVIQKLCSESPLLVTRPDVYSFARANPFVEKKKQKANTGKCFRDYYIIYLILFYPFNAMLIFLQKHLVVCNLRLTVFIRLTALGAY